MQKQRISYADFVAMRRGNSEGTVAWLIDRFIKEMDGTVESPGIRPLGESHRLTLQRIGRSSIGAKVATDLTKHDIIEYVKERRRKVCAATCQQDFTFLAGVLKYAPAAWPDCEKVSHLPLELAKPFLRKLGLIGKSQPRERRPTSEEIEQLLAYFTKQNKHHCTKVDMVLITRWQLASSRRIGETCALLWEDWDRENHTILVRKMKDPKNKHKRKVVALPDEAQAMLEELWPLRNPEEPRIFPFYKKSCSARYTLAKKALGIKNLRLHDSRRDCGTRLVEEKGFSPAEAILFTGHETVAVFERTYLKQKPELLKNGPRSIRIQQERSG